mgnify:FL=1
MKWNCRDWECMGLKGVVELFTTHRNEMLVEYPLCIYFLFRDNCFGLSAEDSRDCCRQCMMIRQTETNQWNVSWNLTVDGIH